ncbi:MAG: DUF502 domain-containing protein [Candidatus Omnitrophica bacterium]|nr:DUF502 domain-containing protein [Candidatus Omnitrophota bacterium]
MIKHIRRYFIAGLLVVLPLFFSLYILWVLFSFADGILGRFINVYLKQRLGFYIPGLGLILFLLIIFLIGVLTSHFLGRRLYCLFERVFSRFPLVQYIYPSLKQIFEFLFSKNHLSFKKAVLLQYPTKDSWTIGFITNEGFGEAREKTAKDLLNIFVPLSPNPISGFLIFASRADVIILDMSIEEAMKLVVSGGLLNPEFK